MKCKRLIALLLSLIITVSVFPSQLVLADTGSGGELATVAQEGGAIWDGSTAQGYAGGNGTYENPYQIATAEQLAFLAEQVNAGNTYQETYFLLIDDIYLNTSEEPRKNNWTPIGSGEWLDDLEVYSEFAGTFDGGLCKIYGLYCDHPNGSYIGLFGSLAGYVDNLTLIDSYVRGYYAVGGIAGSLGGDLPGGLWNCSNDGTVLGHIPAGDGEPGCIGGLVGAMWDNSYLDSCYNKATVGCTTDEAGEGVCMDSVGGLVGSVSTGESIDITYCHNEGDIILDAPCATNIGGLAGDGGYGYFDECCNLGDITVAARSERIDPFDSYAIGGLFGSADAGLKASNCYNAGNIDVYSAATATRIGGIVGDAQINPSDYYYSGYLTNCYHVGNIAVGSGKNQFTNIGGAVGYVYRSGYVSEIVQNVYYLASCLSEDLPAEAIQAYGTALTAEEMQTQAALIGFDFETVWTFDPALPGGYPTLLSAYCEHSYVDGVCTKCTKQCYHDYWTADGNTCRGCGIYCAHESWEFDEEYHETYCKDCGRICLHRYENSICTVCGYPCSHDYYDGVCGFCGDICTQHQWEGAIGKCDICALPCDHDEVQDGMCQACGLDMANITPWAGEGESSDWYNTLRFAAGDGTKENPYRITNGDELFCFAQCVRNGIQQVQYAYVVLLNDIDLANHSFPSIGYSSDNWSDATTFYGNFDGRGHKILNYANTEEGLFGLVYGESSEAPAGADGLGRIANVHVYGTITNAGSGDVGGIVGKGDSFTVENCSFTGTITVSDNGYSFYGGIAGEYQYGFLTNCTSDTDIYVGSCARGVGGIVGGGEYGTPVVNGCANLGRVEAVDAAHLSGIGGADIVLNSYNAGDVIGHNSGNSGNYIYGVDGRYVINCYNTGNIGTAEDCTAQYGEICGIAGNYLINCYNTGELLVHFPEGVEINEDTDDDGTYDVYAAAFFGFYAKPVNCYTLPSVFPTMFYYYETESNYDWAEEYDEGKMTLSDMSTRAFARLLTANAEAYGSFTDGDYGRVSQAELLTWKRGVATPVFGVEDAPVLTLEVIAQATDGNVAFDGQVSMDGLANEFEVGDTVKLSAVYSGNEYRFIGWYAAGDLAMVLASTKNYSFAVTEEMAEKGTLSLIALYEKVRAVDIAINVSGSASTVKVNGSEQTSGYTYPYLPGTVLTIELTDTDRFAYWEVNGKVVNRSAVYTFTVVNGISVNAIYNTKVENKKIVIFESDYNQIIQRSQMTSDELDASIFPAVPVKTGYGAGVWGMTLDQLRDEFAKEDVDVITVKPVYPAIEDTATVTVVGGTIQGTEALTTAEYTLNSGIVLVADAPADGMQFAYWTDENGTILGYNQSYAFYLAGDVTVTAIFVEHAQAVEQVGTAEIAEIIKQEGKSGISFVAIFDTPEGSTIDFAGVVATSDAAVGQNLTRENATYVRGGAQESGNGRFTWTKSNAGADTTWYVRAYLVYTDADGVTHTVYSSVVTAVYGELN